MNIFELSFYAIVVVILVYISYMITKTKKASLPNNPPRNDGSGNSEFIIRNINLPECRNDEELLCANHESLPDRLELGNEGSSITFNKIEFPKLNDESPNFPQISSTLTATVPAAVIDAIALNGAKALFHATVSPAQLMQYADSTFSSIVRGSQHINAHAGFTPVGSVGIFAPLIVFQVLSIVTGQYYMNGITKQLGAISRRIEYLIQLHHTEKISTLQADYERLTELSKRNAYALEDLIEVRMVLKDAYAIHREYSNLVSQINIKEFEKVLEHFSTKTMVNELEKKFIDSNVIFNTNLLLFSRRVLFAAKLLEIKINIYMAQREQYRIYNTKSFLLEIEHLNNEFKYNHNRYTAILNAFTTSAKKIEYQAFRESSQNVAKSLADTFVKNARETLNEIKELSDEVNDAYNALYVGLGTNKNVYILIGKKGEMIPISEK